MKRRPAPSSRRSARSPSTARRCRSRFRAAIYLLDPKPGDRYRILLAATASEPISRSPGPCSPIAQTGQLVVKFKDLPQSPLTEFNMHFFGSERGLLATPTQCGSYPVESEFVPWDAALLNQTSVSYFTVDTGPDGGACPNGPRPFCAPVRRREPATRPPGCSLRSRSNSPAATGEQNLSRSTSTRPPGLRWRPSGASPTAPRRRSPLLGSSAYSGLAELASPTCPASSQVGTVTAGAGAGSHQVYLRGSVYLAGPYKGSPLSLVVVDAGRLRSLRPRQRRRQGRDQRRSRHRPGERGLRPAAADPRGHPSAAAFDPDQPRPAGLHAQPDQLRPVRARARPSAATKAGSSSPRTGFQVANCATSPTGRS